MEKAGAPFYFHSVVGGGHNPYFGLNFNSARTSFEGKGGGIGLFEDPMVEPLIFGFFRHYLLERKKTCSQAPAFRQISCPALVVSKSLDKEDGAGIRMALI